MAQFKVFMRSTAGFYEQYDGFVEVNASDDRQAIDRAFQKLRSRAFPDRDRSFWRVEKVERLYK